MGVYRNMGLPFAYSVTQEGIVTKKTVLVVEDNAGDRVIYGNILWYNGFDVIFATDGEAGYRLAKERLPSLILLDLGLPLLHGSELSSRLQQDDDTKDIPLVALTGRRLSEFGGNATVLGYARFLEKPVSPLQVLKVVEQLIGRATIDQAHKLTRPEVLSTNEPADVAAEPAAPPHEATKESRAIAEALAGESAAVLDIWQQLVIEEPWFSLPREDRVGFLSEVIASLGESALLAPNFADSCRKTVVAASAHGRHRRAQGIPEGVIPIEFHLLRQAIYRHLAQRFPLTEDLHSAIITLDGAVSLALNACMWGYFRDEIEAQGMWDTAVERLVESACSIGPSASKETVTDV